MSSTHKKVVVRKLDRDSVQGYLPASNFISDGKLELINTAGTGVRIQLSEIKGVFFVREFGDSEVLPRKTFASRPRTEGLWLRIRFRDGETLEGLMPNDLTQITPEGFFVNPPDTRANTQRIFVPRSGLSEVTVLAVIGSQARRRPPEAADTRQAPLFSDAAPTPADTKTASAGDSGGKAGNSGS
ncbi:MAG: hypothetical protein ABSD88_11555 [Candidatus Korobacteraceae bacterium]|jgi:hypothetical protein